MRSKYRHTKNSNIFYDISEDLKKTPETAIYIVLGGRGTGKTYSTLRFMYEHNERFIFMKRTNKDVNLLCQPMPGKTIRESAAPRVDLSPFKSLNRDFGWNVRGYRIFDGLGGFYKCADDGSPVGDPIGYVLSFNFINKFKGFDLSDCNYIVFDEFIPLPYERVNRNEGLELLDLYRTVGRANNILHGTVLKLICLANSTTVSCPVLNELELTDTLVDMKSNNLDELNMKDRGIFIRIVPDINGFREKESQNPIYKAMRGTKWAKMSLDNDFAYNDFSSVRRVSIKGMRCICRIKYKEKYWYVYTGANGSYMCTSASKSYDFDYDLNHENDQKLFYTDQDLDLRDQCIEGRMNFESYEMYDIIINYKDYFKL